MRKFHAISYLPLILIATFLLVGVAGAANPVTVNVNIPGGLRNVTGTAEGVCNIIFNFYDFALALGGVLALGAITYGGVKYTFAAGNPSGQSEGKAWIKDALLGLLLLAGAYMILNVINPDLTKCGLEALTPVGTTLAPSVSVATSTSSNCSNPSALAAQYNETYPRKDAPALSSLRTCIEQGASLAGKSVGSIFTYDQTYDLCNYTRGNAICTIKCSHSRNSCHYGGASGNQGSLAVDYGNEQNGAFLVSQAMTCGAASARCENSNGTTVSCSNFDADHIHVSALGC